MINVSHCVAFLRLSALTQCKTPESAFARVLCVCVCPSNGTLVLAIGVKLWRKMRALKNVRQIVKRFGRAIVKANGATGQLAAQMDMTS